MDHYFRNDEIKKVPQKRLLLVGSQMTTGGAQRALLQLAQCFHDRGYSVIAAFFYDKDGIFEDWQKAYPFELVNLDAWDKHEKKLSRFLRLFKGLQKLYCLIRKEKISFVISFTHHSNLLAIPMAWMAGVPVRVATHRGKIYGFPRWQEKLHTRMINSGIASALLAVSESTRKDAIEEGVEPERVFVIPNGVDSPDLDEKAGCQVRQSLGIRSDQKVFFYAGRLNYEKGPDLLLKAFAEVINAVPDSILLLAGDGPMRLELEELAQSLKISERIIFLGVRNDVPELMAAADVFVLSSRTEGMPNAVLEAMALSTPVVAFEVGGVRDLLQDGVTGKFSLPADPNSLARSMIELGHDEEKRRKLALAGKKFVDENYRLDKVCKMYEDFLSSLFHRGAGLS